MIKIMYAQTKGYKGHKEENNFGEDTRGGARESESGEIGETRTTKTSYFAKNSHNT